MNDFSGTGRSAADAMGEWRGGGAAVSFAALSAASVLASMRQRAAIVEDPANGRRGLALGSPTSDGEAAYPLLGLLAPLYPEWLGDRRFTESHGLRFAYVGGSMARGIASAELVIALAGVGGLGMFGAAGLKPDVVEAAIDRISAALDPQGLPWGCNLIHSPGETGLEVELVELYLRRRVRRVEASAFMRLSKPVVLYASAPRPRPRHAAAA